MKRMGSLPNIPGMGSARPGSRGPGGIAAVPGGEGLKPGAPPAGKGGQKAGMPNFRSRINRPGGMKKGGLVKAGQGSGIGRLQRS